jgi:predicted permease
VSGLQDLRYALRAFRTRPLHASLTVLVLAIAIGANTTVFSVINGLFLKPLPYPDGDRLVMVYNAYEKIGLKNAGISIPDYLDRRAQAPALADLAIFQVGGRALGGEGQTQEVAVALASPSLFGVLGVAPELGRAFTEREATPGDDGVAVLSHDLWMQRFGGRSDVIGREIRLDGRPLEIVGVMPAGFGFPSRLVQVWVPYAFTPAQASDTGRGNEFSTAIGRLKPGATVAQLNAELDVIVRRNAERLQNVRNAVTEAGFTGHAQPWRQAEVGNLAQLLLILQATVLAVLLIACANLANLQLARLATRQRELALRTTLGATRGQLLRLVLAEAAVLSAAGAALGLAVAYGGLVLVRLLGLDRASQGYEFGFDLRVLAFTAGVAVLAALGAGLLPALGAIRTGTTGIAHDTGRRTAGTRAARATRSSLVVVQIAASVALLVGAGLLTRSFYELRSAGAGFAAEGVWTARFALPAGRYQDPAASERYLSRALQELGALPGVSAVGYTSALPFSGAENQTSTVIDGYRPAEGTPPPHALESTISEGYFPALGIPVVVGRNFNASEPERVAIVDKNFADRYWPSGNVLGQRVRRTLDGADQWYTIVGVVPAVKHGSLAEDPRKETVYWHYQQRPANSGAFTLRTALPPERLTPLATAVALRIDADVPLFNAAAMDSRLQQSLGPQRTAMTLTLLFAATAFVLAVIGIYGVLTWAVTQRVAEIGVRVALGARTSDVVGMVLQQGGRMIALGLVIGGVLAVLLGRVLATQIQSIRPLDPLVFAIAIGGLGAAALLASWLPARHAASIDPMQALRSE